MKTSEHDHRGGFEGLGRRAGPGRARMGVLAGSALAGAAVLLYVAWARSRSGPGGSGPDAPNARGVEGAPVFVGVGACAACHEAETSEWTGSHHALAMQPATDASVLGDFADAAFTQFGVTSTFFRRGGRFMVNTDGPDGGLADFEITHTFGVYPLQQYLVEFGGGRKQALDIAWDARPAAEGGRRWFHLHPEDPVRAGDVLHWTGPALNWNFMCAECHSTDLRKNYDGASDAYRTTWSEISVSCEACHGPGSRHVEWARSREAGRPDPDPLRGLVTALRTEPPAWEFDGSKPTARRVRARTSRAELDACARCHSRREVIADPYVHGRPLGETHRVALLDDGLYFADGQQRDEVYEYGSFLQSKMYAAGVTCTDCHEPHGVRRPESADGYCARCHEPEHFATPSHHHHAPESSGAGCVACHMPSRLYMVVDARRDHSFRVPRPDLTLSIGAPNACADCHADRSPEWAAAQVAAWRPPGSAPPRHYGEAIHAGRTGHLDAERLLSVLALDATQPAIARATALSLLGPYLSPGNFAPIERGMRDPDPMVRGAAARLIGAMPPDTAVRWAAPLLDDPVRAVRLEAAWTLLNSPEGSPETGRLRERAAGEYQSAQMINRERAEARTNLGALASLTADAARAEEHFTAALGINPRFIPARLGLADAYRQRGREDRAEEVLRAGLALVPESADLHHALGFALVRAGRPGDALGELRRAVELDPDAPSFSYGYGVALNSLGRAAEALEVLERAHLRRPTDRELLVALATISRDAGQTARAIEFARRLVALSPSDPRARGLLADLTRR